MKKNPPSAKHAAAPRAKSGGGTLLGLFIGLVLGIVVAFGVVWYLNKSPLPFLDKTQRAEPDKHGTKNPQEPLPGKPGDKAGEKPRFEFYKILPGGQEATPAPAAPPPVPPVAEPAATVPAEQFLLQAGAFQKTGDADNLKAKLALIGMEAAIQETAVPDKGTMFRVRIGPYATPEEMNKARNQLAQNGIQATVIKIKN